MSFYKYPSSIKISILGFIKHMLNKTQVKAIDLLLSPCCGITIEDIEFTCTSTAVATATITLSKGVNFPVNGNAVVTVFQSGSTRSYSITYSGGATTVVVPSVTIFGANAFYTVTFTLPINSDLTEGVFTKTDTLEVTNPTCP